MACLDPNRDWKTLLSFLPEDYERLAVEHGQVRLQWANAKITSVDALLRLIFVHVGADLPLRQTVAVVAKAGGPNLSAVRLHVKMRSSLPYLQALVAEMTTFAADGAPERWSGYELVAVDATTVSGPGSEGVDARIHTVIRLHDLALPHVQITDVSGGETLKRFSWAEGQLVIADRGYSNAPGIAWVVDQGADVLVRVNRGALPLFDEDAPIDVLDWCRTLTGHKACARTAHVEHREGRVARRIQGRLIGFRLPDKEAAEARERVLREHGAKTSAEQLEAAGYVVLFTTALAGRLSAARCVEAYRLRWQIELQFKRWKSICHFDRLPNYRDDTIRAWLCAKVLLGLLLDRMGSAPSELSPPVQLVVPGQQAREPRFGARVGSNRAAHRATALEAHDAPLARNRRGDFAHEPL
jgi:hypothetical protein